MEFKIISLLSFGFSVLTFIAENYVKTEDDYYLIYYCFSNRIFDSEFNFVKLDPAVEIYWFFSGKYFFLRNSMFDSDFNWGYLFPIPWYYWKFFYKFPSKFVIVSLALGKLKLFFIFIILFFGLNYFTSILLVKKFWLKFFGLSILYLLLLIKFKLDYTSSMIRLLFKFLVLFMEFIG